MIALPWSRRDESSGKPTAKRRVLRFVWRHIASLLLFLLISAFVITVLAPYMVVNVPSGQVGVLWKRFGGTVLDPRSLRNEGLNIILPWDRMFLYDLRIRSISETYNAISSDGVNLNATVNIRFRLRREFIPQLHQAVGPDFLNLLGPEVASRMREVISKYTAEQVYSTDRQTIQDEIKNRVIEKLGERFLEREGAVSYRIPFRSVGDLYDTLLHEIKLPAAVISAINRKAEQYYVSQEYVYRVERERRESERKKIEAEGIRDFQQTVGQGISDSYLRLRGIEATLELAKSNNSKIVIIGGGRDGTPIILGNVDSPAGPSPGASIQPGPISSGASAPPAEGESDIKTTGPAPAGSPPPEKPKQDDRSQSSPSSVQDFIARLWNHPLGGSAAPIATPTEVMRREQSQPKTQGAP